MQYIHLNDWYKVYKAIVDLDLAAEPSLQPVIELCRPYMSESSQHQSPAQRHQSAPFPDETRWCNLSMLFDLCINGTALEHTPELAAARDRLQSLTQQREHFYAQTGETPPDMVSSFVRQFL